MHRIGKPTIVAIPHELLKEGKNVLAIKTGTIDNKSGFVYPIKIGPSNLIFNYFIRHVVWYTILTAVNLFITIYFLFFYFYRKEKYYLHFSLLSLAFGLWSFGFHGLNFYIFDNHLVYIISTYICAIAICICYINFIHSFLKIPYSIFAYIMQAVLASLIAAICIELVVTQHIVFYNKYIFKIFIISALLVVFYGDVICVLGKLRSRPYSLRIFSGTFALSLTYLISILSFLEIIKLHPPVSEGFFVMIIIFASTLAVRFSQVHTDLEKAHADLLVVDRMKDDFLATTTHELRTPLHGIIGIAESLADGSMGEISGRQKENLDLIASSASRLNELVNSILDFSKLRAGKADLYIDELSIGDIISSAVSLMQPVAREKKVSLTAEIGEVPKIKADRNRIYQVMLNLLGNALKFTETGSVTVKAGAANRGRVRVSVADTGIGIREEDLARIWSPFTQAEAPERRTSGGTGLGLAITKHLVELHGGSIGAESEPGKGSVFSFELPPDPPVAGISFRAPEAAVPAGGHAPLPAPQQDIMKFNITVNPSVAQATILAVDDDPVGLKILENMCASCGHRLITTSNGPAALDIIERRDVDLVLLDLMLPGMSGYEVCEKMRQSEKGSAIPVIMLTALDQAGHMVRGFRTGANDYITKPFKRHELVLRIENQLAIKQMLEMEKSVISKLRSEKDAIAGLFQRSRDIKECAIQMLAWEKIIQDDLAIASAFQHKLMTNQPDIEGFETAVLYRPLQEIGGDVYDIFEVRPGVVRAFIADATGHGINASLGTVRILSEYAAIKGTLGSPGEVINFLNQRFTQAGGQSPIVFTCVAADIDLASSSATVSAAGAPAQFLLRGREAVVVNPRNPIIGLSNTIEYSEETHAFGKGDILFLYTDGLADLAAARGDEDDEYEQIAAALASVYPGSGLDEAGEKLFKRLAGGGRKASDDVTIVAVRRV
ncbi:MAG: SpoIIE family protein phosphatase [Spirochaetes bacterium]|nr:SpoIIE family protein phosphatase [Spirochaetota bacterium]